jgi:hypothetical protein
VRQDFYRKLEKLERNHAAARRAAVYRNRPSGADVMRTLLSGCAVEQLSGESRAETLSRAAGISTRDLKNLLSGRCFRCT